MRAITQKRKKRKKKTIDRKQTRFIMGHSQWKGYIHFAAIEIPLWLERKIQYDLRPNTTPLFSHPRPNKG